MRSVRKTLSDISNTPRNGEMTRDNPLKLGRARTVSQLDNSISSAHSATLKRTCTYNSPTTSKDKGTSRSVALKAETEPYEDSREYQETPAKAPRDMLDDTRETPRTPRVTKAMMNAQESTTKPQRDYDALKLIELKPFKLDAALFNSYLYRGRMIVPAYSAIARQDSLTNSPKFTLSTMEARVFGRNHSQVHAEIMATSMQTPVPGHSGTVSRGGWNAMQTPIGVPRLTRQQERLLLTAQQQNQERQQKQSNSQSATPLHKQNSTGLVGSRSVRQNASRTASASQTPAVNDTLNKDRTSLKARNASQLELHDLKRIIEEDDDLDSLLHDEGHEDDSGKRKKDGAAKVGKGKTRGSDKDATQRALFQTPATGSRTRRAASDENAENIRDDVTDEEDQDTSSYEDSEESENCEDSNQDNSDGEYDDSPAEETELEDEDLSNKSDVSSSLETIQPPESDNDPTTAFSLRSDARYSTRRQTRLQLQQAQEQQQMSQQQGQADTGSTSGRRSSRLVTSSKDGSFMFGGLQVNSTHLNNVSSITPANHSISQFDTASKAQRQEAKDKVIQVVVKYPLMGSWTEWKDSFQTCKDEVELYREIKTWRCPYLLRFYGTHGPGIVFEFVDGDSLDGLLDAEPNDIAKQTWLWSELGEHIATGLYYLHLLNISHNDIKPENVRYSQSKGIWKLLDLGLATDLYAHVCRSIGTDGYRAPEVAQRGLLHAKSDVYGLGVMMEEALICIQRRYLPLHELFVGGGGEIPTFMLESESNESDNEEGESSNPPKDPKEVREEAEQFKKLLPKTTAYRAYTRTAGPRAKSLESFAETWDELHAVMSDIVSKCLERSPDKRPSIKRLVHVFRAVQRYEAEMDAPLRALQSAKEEISKYS